MLPCFDYTLHRNSALFDLFTYIAKYDDCRPVVSYIRNPADPDAGDPSVFIVRHCTDNHSCQNDLNVHFIDCWMIGCCTGCMNDFVCKNRQKIISYIENHKHCLNYFPDVMLSPTFLISPPYNSS